MALGNVKIQPFKIQSPFLAFFQMFVCRPRLPFILFIKPPQKVPVPVVVRQFHRPFRPAFHFIHLAKRPGISIIVSKCSLQISIGQKIFLRVSFLFHLFDQLSDIFIHRLHRVFVFRFPAHHFQFSKPQIITVDTCFFRLGNDIFCFPELAVRPESPCRPFVDLRHSRINLLRLIISIHDLLGLSHFFISFLCIKIRPIIAIVYFLYFFADLHDLFIVSLFTKKRAAQKVQLCHQKVSLFRQMFHCLLEGGHRRCLQIRRFFALFIFQFFKTHLERLAFHFITLGHPVSLFLLLWQTLLFQALPPKPRFRRPFFVQPSRHVQNGFYSVAFRGILRQHRIVLKKFQPFLRPAGLNITPCQHNAFLRIYFPRLFFRIKSDDFRIALIQQIHGFFRIVQPPGMQGMFLGFLPFPLFREDFGQSDRSGINILVRHLFPFQQLLINSGRLFPLPAFF